MSVHSHPFAELGNPRWWTGFLPMYHQLETFLGQRVTGQMGRKVLTGQVGEVNS